jgi:L-alanine-DL-glutamate epimerase-like enolase superfamily enzyme
MARQPIITRIEITAFQYAIENLRGSGFGYDMGYQKGPGNPISKFALRIFTDAGVTGEYVTHWVGNPISMAQVEYLAPYLLGKPALERQRFYTDMNRFLRQWDRMGIGPIDIALWDLAGKLHDAPVHQLLGGYRKRLPTYASTYHGDRDGGLDSAEAFADFARQCKELGYPAFKIHGWVEGRVQEEVKTVLAVRQAVGERMELMVDPACTLMTWADTLRLGRACDEAHYFWYEDPYRDKGISIHGHRRLKDFIKTPILITEHTRGLEHIVDVIAAEATDFVRVDPEYDCGITGALKIASAAEGFGLDVEVHACGPAHRHLMSALRNSNYYELALVHPKMANAMPPVYADGYADQLHSIDRDGCVAVPEGPGLGVTYDWKAIQDMATGKREFKS